MKLIDLYNRVVETTGLEVVTTESLSAAVSNCFADLTSRGYRNFKEDEITDFTIQGGNLLTAPAPILLRKSLYCKVQFNESASQACRIALTNPYLQSKVVGTSFRSDLYRLGVDVIYYIKNDTIYIEWKNTLQVPNKIIFGYYARLDLPAIIENTDSLGETVIPIRREFEDAIVFYACYFYYARYIKDTEKIAMYQSQYKYYVEDILHELNHEDNYYEEDAVITTDVS